MHGTIFQFECDCGLVFFGGRAADDVDVPTAANIEGRVDPTCPRCGRAADKVAEISDLNVTIINVTIINGF